MPLKPRHIQPGYSAGLCSIAIYEKVNCLFAQQMYSKYLKNKWGVNACIDDEFDRYFIKKKILDFNMIYDPEMCVTCEDLAIAPCGIVATGQVFNTRGCEAPEDVEALVEYVEIDCEEPEDVVATLEYQGIR